VALAQLPGGACIQFRPEPLGVHRLARPAQRLPVDPQDLVLRQAQLLGHGPCRGLRARRTPVARELLSHYALQARRLVQRGEGRVALGYASPVEFEKAASQVPLAA
jgi:hypothetical protein